MSKQIYEQNRMLYDFKQSSSVKLLPTDLQIIPFDDQEYNFSDTMTATFTSGEYFLDPQKSYISVSIKVGGDDSGQLKLNFGRGSISNLWNSIKIYTKSGTQISNVQNIDLWTKNRQTMTKDEFWKQSIGHIQGYRSNPATEYIFNQNTGVGGTEELQFKIKLSELHPFFKGTEDKLLAPEIIDNLRIELDTNAFNKVFTQGDIASPIVSSVISKSEIQMALVKVNDESLDVVSDMASKQGLKWSYSDVFITTRQVAADENNVNVNIDKACSHAKNIVSFLRNTTDSVLSSDSYNYPQIEANKWNYRIHNTLYPYKRQVSETADSYSAAIDAYDWEFGTNLKYTDFVLHNNNYVTNLKTDDHILHSGEFLNANKRVELQFEKATLSESKYLHSCLEYVKVLSVNGTNSRIDE
tara:strand:- start:71 stop:1306 length:1236 start_codon:yes stop_codon:yes gene_type:complete